MKEILTTLFRRKRAFLAFFACMVAFPMALTYILPPAYQAKATVLLTASRFKKPFLPDERDARTSFIQLSMEDVGSEVELMTSYPVLAKVVDTCGLDRDEPPPRTRLPKWCAYHLAKGAKGALQAIGLLPEVPAREAAIHALRRKVDVDFIRRTNIITVTWRGSSPGQARNVVNALVDAYLTHHIKVHGNAYVLEALRGQLAESQERLRQAEDSLSAYNSRYSISDVEAQRHDLLDKLSQAEDRIKLLGNVSRHNLSPETLGALTEESSVSELSKRLTDAEMRRIDLSTRYGADERRLLSSAQEIGQLQGLILKRVGKSLATWKSLAETYRAELTRLDGHKLKIDRIKQEIQDLQRVVELNREKTDEVLISKAMDKAALAGARVVEEAVADPAPAFPKRLPILVICLFFGVVFGAAFVIAMDAASLRVLSVADVERVAQAPVLASIPLFRNGKAPGLESPSDQCARALLPVPAGLPLSADAAAPMRSVLLVSPSPGAGVTTLCNQLGGMLATAGPTAILDFGEDGAAGPGDDAAGSLAAGEGLVRDERYGVYRLSLPPASQRLSAGKPQPPAWLESLRKAGIRNLLIDAGAPQADARYLQFVHLVDHVILVTAYNFTSKPALARLAEVIRRQGGRLNGCLYNRREDVIPDFLYRRIF